jgi:hypothetical protein
MTHTPSPPSSSFLLTARAQNVTTLSSCQQKGELELLHHREKISAELGHVQSIVDCDNALCLICKHWPLALEKKDSTDELDIVERRMTANLVWMALQACREVCFSVSHWSTFLYECQPGTIEEGVIDISITMGYKKGRHQTDRVVVNRHSFPTPSEPLVLLLAGRMHEVIPAVRDCVVMAQEFLVPKEHKQLCEHMGRMVEKVCPVIFLINCLCVLFVLRNLCHDCQPHWRSDWSS